MAQAEIHEVMSVDRDKLFDVITRYEDYPQFVTGCSSVEVERKSPGRVQVTYHVNMIKDITYTIELSENREQGVVEWKLIHSDFLRKNNGRWDIQPAGAGKTDVRYEVEVEFKIPVPGLILNRLVKGSLPSMVESFVERAQGSA